MSIKCQLNDTLSNFSARFFKIALTAADARTAWSNRLSVTSRPRVSLGTTLTDRQTDGQLTVTQTLLRISMRAVPVAACQARIMHMHIYAGLIKTVYSV